MKQIERLRFHKLVEELEAFLDESGHKSPRPDLLPVLRDYVVESKTLLRKVDIEEGEIVDLSPEQYASFTSFESILSLTRTAYK
jgi:hypothetical protein